MIFISKYMLPAEIYTKNIQDILHSTNENSVISKKKKPVGQSNFTKVIFMVSWFF